MFTCLWILPIEIHVNMKYNKIVARGQKGERPMKHKDFVKLSKEQQEIYWEQARSKFLEKLQKETSKRPTA